MEREGREHPEHHNPVERMEHLRAAAEHLAQAGMGEMAEQVRRRAEEIERELHREREGHEHHHADHPHPEHAEVQHAIRELSEAVEDLRNEIRAIRKRLREEEE